MELKGRQFAAVQGALKSAFPDPKALDQMLAIGMGIRLVDVAADGPLPQVLFDLIRWTEAADRIEELLAAALRAQPSNRQLQAVAADLFPQRFPLSPAGGATPGGRDRALADRQVLEYLDFTLTITPSAGGYLAQADTAAEKHDPGDGPGSSWFELPRPFPELERLTELLAAGSELRKAGAEEYAGAAPLSSALSSAPREFGQRLFELVFKGSLLTELRALGKAAHARRRGVRLRLRLTQVPELLTLPWEYLYDPEDQRFLAQYETTPLVRSLDVLQPLAPLAIEMPLRIRVLIANPRNGDYPELNVAEEWTRLSAALSGLQSEGRVRVTRVEHANRDSVLEASRSGDHIVHFIGHGDFVEAQGGGTLVLEDGSGGADVVTGEWFGQLLRANAHLRLVLLNSCLGARTSATSPFAGTAQGLIRKGIPAVLAMQSSISDEAAVTFSRFFYDELVAGQAVDAAVAITRRMIWGKWGNVPDSRAAEWGTPVLYLHATDGRLFVVNPANTQHAKKGSGSTVFPPLGALDCDSPFYIRRDADDAIEDLVQAPGSTVVIHAPGHTGGSSLLCAVQRRMPVDDRIVLMVNFNESFRQCDLEDVEGFLQWFCKILSNGLKKDWEVEVDAAQHWSAHVPAVTSCTLFVEQVLETVKRPVVLLLDQVDRLDRGEVRSDFFTMLLGWHNRRVYREAWRNLGLVFVTRFDLVELIDVARGEPFDVGERLPLDDFSLPQVQDLNWRYGSPLDDEELVKLMVLVEGHPQLVHYAIYWAARYPRSKAQLFVTPPDDEGPYGRFVAPLLFLAPDLLQAFDRILAGEPLTHAEYLRLRRAGLVRRKSRKIVPRCQLIADYLRDRNR